MQNSSSRVAKFRKKMTSQNEGSLLNEILFTGKIPQTSPIVTTQNQDDKIITSTDLTSDNHT